MVCLAWSGHRQHGLTRHYPRLRLRTSDRSALPCRPHARRRGAFRRDDRVRLDGDGALARLRRPSQRLDRSGPLASRQQGRNRLHQSHHSEELALGDVMNDRRARLVPNGGTCSRLHRAHCSPVLTTADHKAAPARVYRPTTPDTDKSGSEGTSARTARQPALGRPSRPRPRQHSRRAPRSSGRGASAVGSGWALSVCPPDAGEPLSVNGPAGSPQRAPARCGTNFDERCPPQ